MNSDFGRLIHGLHATEAEHGMGCIVETLAMECTMKYLGIVKGPYTQTRHVVMGIVKGLSSHLPWS